MDAVVATICTPTTYRRRPFCKAKRPAMFSLAGIKTTEQDKGSHPKRKDTSHNLACANG